MFDDEDRERDELLKDVVDDEDEIDELLKEVLDDEEDEEMDDER